MTFPDELLDAAEAVLARARRSGRTIAVAESCTGGLLAGSLTAVAGSSEVFERGFVTYSNAAKSEMLGVSADLIAAQGAVSEAVAHAMAEGVLARSPADIAASISGVAGPGGGTADKPVGHVCFAAGARGGAIATSTRRFGDLGRDAVRLASVAEALALLETLAGASALA